jgi:class 3 adenylate cyclase
MSRSLGDGFLANFDGPARAVHCASAIRDSLHRLDVPVRIGVHSGEVELAENDVRGIVAHIASRVTHLGQTDDVLVSRTVRTWLPAPASSSRISAFIAPRAFPKRGRCFALSDLTVAAARLASWRAAR